MKGEGGQKSSKSCQHNLWMAPFNIWNVNFGSKWQGVVYSWIFICSNKLASIWITYQFCNLKICPKIRFSVVQQKQFIFKIVPNNSATIMWNNVQRDTRHSYSKPTKQNQESFLLLTKWTYILLKPYFV